MYSFKSYTGHNWTVAHSNNIFILQDDDATPGTKCKYCVKVEPDYSFTFKIMKTKIKAIGGAAGLCDFVKDCYTTDILQCAVEKIINAITTGYIKEAKQ